MTISNGIGTTKSNGSGRFSVHVTAVPAPATYTATVKKKQIKKGRKRIVCKRARASITIR